MIIAIYARPPKASDIINGGHTPHPKYCRDILLLHHTQYYLCHLTSFHIYLVPLVHGSIFLYYD